MSEKFTDPSSKQRAALRDAESAVLACQLKLARARTQIAARLEKLDAELEPLMQREQELSLELAARESVTLAPWKINDARRWSSAQRYVADAGETSWSNRAWLRVVCRDHRTPQWQWELEMRSIKDERAYNSMIVFGAPDDGPDGGFAAVRAASDKILREEGYLFAEKL